MHHIITGSGKDRIVTRTGANEVGFIRPFDQSSRQGQLIGQRHKRAVRKPERLDDILECVRIEPEQTNRIGLTADLNREHLLERIVYKGQGLQRDSA